MDNGTSILNVLSKFPPPQIEHDNTVLATNVLRDSKPGTDNQHKKKAATQT